MEEIKKKKQSRLWDIIANSGSDQVSRGGWKNSYNGDLFSKEEMKEFADDVYLKLEQYLDENSTIALEVGCASGLTMYRIAPYCKYYIGTDLASYNLGVNTEYNRKNKIDNIELEQCAADEIDKFFDKGITVVVINSVIQYFENMHYLTDVIEKAMKIVGNNGVVYIGDVRDIEKKEEFEKSVREYKVKNNLPIPLARKELFVNRDYFKSLEEIYSQQIKEVIVSEKIGTIKNELTNYRYDVMIKMR